MTPSIIVASCLLLIMPKESPQLPSNPYSISTTTACGPFCISFLLGWFEKDVNYSAVSERCKTGPNGTSFENVNKTLHSFGLKTSPIRAPLSTVISQQNPAIITLRNYNGGSSHYAVLLSVRDESGNILMYNPPGRLQYVSIDKLNEYYDNTAILVSESDILFPSDSDSYSVLLLGLLFSLCFLLFGLIRKLPSGLVTVCIILLAPGCGTNEADRPALDPRRFVDFGAIEYRPTISHVFFVQNPLKDAANIRVLEKSCTCQAVSAQYEKASEGEWARVSYTAPLLPGIDSSQVSRLVVQFVSRYEVSSPIELAMSATVVDPISLSPRRLVFGSVPHNGSSLRTVTIRAMDSSLMKTAPRAVSKDDRVVITLLSMSDGICSYSISVQPEVGHPIDTTVQFICDQTDDVLNLDITASAQGPVVCFPKEIIYSNISNSPSRVITLMSPENTSFTVIDVTAPEGMSVVKKDPNLSYAPKHAYLIKGLLDSGKKGEIVFNTSLDSNIRIGVSAHY